MRPMKLTLGVIATATLGIVAAACSGGGSSGGGSHKFESGAYNFTIGSVPSDTCVPTFDGALVNQVVAFNIDVPATGGTFTLTAGGTVGAVIPPINGTYSGNSLTAAGTGQYVVSTGCTLGITADAPGTLTADDEFDDTITANITAATTASNGLPSDCTGAMLGGIVPLNLSPAGTGSCAITLAGHGVKS